jgi:dimethylhistidine N-methyltransferase
MSSFYEDVIAGLQQRPKALDSKYFYDARGAALFERICEQPAYYIPRLEMAILRQHAAAIALLAGESVQLVELGSGAGVKTRILLEALRHVAAYVPVDIAREQLQAVANRLRHDFPRLAVRPLCADFTAELRLPHHEQGMRPLVFFPGSTVGNFAPREARRLLAGLRLLAGASGAVLLGLDLKKDPEVLHRAYNDEDGATAAFNLNLLARANRELGADFVLERFRHYAFYNPVAGRIEMTLLSLARQTVTIGVHEFTLDVGEPIVTEYSYKYTPSEFATLAASAGLLVTRLWLDADSQFAVVYLVPEGGPRAPLPSR